MFTLKELLKEDQESLYEILLETYYDNLSLFNFNNYILVKGDLPVLLIAHLDTVHSQVCKDICESADGNILMSPQGIGGDDRCGVYAIAKVYDTVKKKPWLLFTCDEEIGGVGSTTFANDYIFYKKKLNDFNPHFMIQVDRRGYKQAVYYTDDNTEFHQYIESFGFKEHFGSFTDICHIMPVLGVSGVNLSAGYYNEHTIGEYINITHLDYTIDKIKKILSRPTKKYKYARRFPSYGSYFDIDNLHKEIPSSYYKYLGKNGGLDWDD